MVFKALGTVLNQFASFSSGGDEGGQGVNEHEENILQAAGLFQKMNLKDPERAKALSILRTFAEKKSKRIFIRMLLLPAMLDLGYPTEKCVKVCRDGLGYSEDYYRIQAAGLLADVAVKRPTADLNEGALLRDDNVSVRVDAAKIHWLKHRDAKIVVPILVDALDRSKYQSYYYSQTQREALGVLGEIGPDAKSALSAIVALKEDPNAAVVKLASEVGTKISDAQGKP